jgi:hypothetical protein
MLYLFSLKALFAIVPIVAFSFTEWIYYFTGYSFSWQRLLRRALVLKNSYVPLVASHKQ